jgi:hypothetical protein
MVLVLFDETQTGIWARKIKHHEEVEKYVRFVFSNSACVC